MTQVSPDSVVLGIQYDAKGHADVIAAELLRGSRREHGNIAVVGPPGSGKGLMIKANLLNWQHSVIVVDLKGDTHADTADFRERALGQQVFVLDPKSATGHRIDPVAITPKENRRQLAFDLVSRGEPVSSEAKFWVNSALNWWLAAWSAASLEGQPHMPFAVQLSELGLAGSALYLLEHHGDHPEVMTALTAFLGNHPKLIPADALLNPSRLLEGKWATVLESVTPFAHPAIMSLRVE